MLIFKPQDLGNVLSQEEVSRLLMQQYGDSMHTTNNVPLESPQQLEREKEKEIADKEKRNPPAKPAVASSASVPMAHKGSSVPPKPAPAPPKPAVPVVIRQTETRLANGKRRITPQLVAETPVQHINGNTASNPISIDSPMILDSDPTIDDGDSLTNDKRKPMDTNLTSQPKTVIQANQPKRRREDAIVPTSIPSRKENVVIPAVPVAKRNGPPISVDFQLEFNLKFISFRKRLCVQKILRNFQQS